ncbi:hypothetical protein [Paraburkholderia caffeinilytica]|nr:hypothetical protein [Paraburkholderia caffeinilytica]
MENLCLTGARKTQVFDFVSKKNKSVHARNGAADFYIININTSQREEQRQQELNDANSTKRGTRTASFFVRASPRSEPVKASSDKQ